jgi:hypothetical protein
MNILVKYCDGYAQGIVGRQTDGCVLAHAPHNGTVEEVPSCLRTEGCYTMHAQLRNTTVAIM